MIEESSIKKKKDRMKTNRKTYLFFWNSIVFLCGSGLFFSYCVIAYEVFLLECSYRLDESWIHQYEKVNSSSEMSYGCCLERFWTCS